MLKASVNQVAEANPKPVENHVSFPTTAVRTFVTPDASLPITSDFQQLHWVGPPCRFPSLADGHQLGSAAIAQLCKACFVGFCWEESTFSARCLGGLNRWNPSQQKALKNRWGLDLNIHDEGFCYVLLRGGQEDSMSSLAVKSLPKLDLWHRMSISIWCRRSAEGTKSVLPVFVIYATLLHKTSTQTWYP